MRLGCKLRDLNKLSQAQHHSSHTLDAVTSHKFLTHTVASLLMRLGCKLRDLNKLSQAQHHSSHNLGYSFNIASFVFLPVLGSASVLAFALNMFTDEAIVAQLYTPISLSQI
jgi:hypothetical protein